MANTFYNDACIVDAKNTPFPADVKTFPVDGEKFGVNLAKNKEDGNLHMPHSIMNENTAINYRTIYNGYGLFSTSSDFTELSDYQRCMKNNDFYTSYLRDKKNPTYKNIISYYASDNFDPHGLAKYRMQDFIYLKYYNQIPNNYMITLRRYTRPCEDHMFGLDMEASAVNGMNGYSDDYFALATAVTYMGEKAGNKLSDILKFDYGAEWEEKTGAVESLQNPDGGLAAQMKERAGVNGDLISGSASLGGSNSITAQMRSLITFSAGCLGKGVSVNKAMSSQYDYEGNVFNTRYGEEFYGDVNVVNKVKMRSRGLTFSNNISLNFEYSLKSLKCVNPRVAMIDILSNFLILTGNYGTFWGGATIYYGNRNIAPQYGDPDELRKGNYGNYIRSVAEDVKQGFQKITEMDKIESAGDFFQGLWNAVKNVGSGFMQGLVGNLLGGNIGVAGQAQVPKALLSGAPSGFWHLTIGNPLDPIAVMGNMAVTKTTVQFSDQLGYDDFPTEIKFTVELEHARPRENGGIEAMFNGGKGRFYTFESNDILNAYHNIDTMKNFKNNDYKANQEKNVDYSQTGASKSSPSTHGLSENKTLKIIGGFLNG